MWKSAGFQAFDRPDTSWSPVLSGLGRKSDQFRQIERQLLGDFRV